MYNVYTILMGQNRKKTYHGPTFDLNISNRKINISLWSIIWWKLPPIWKFKQWPHFMIAYQGGLTGWQNNGIWCSSTSGSISHGFGLKRQNKLKKWINMSNSFRVNPAFQLDYWLDVYCSNQANFLPWRPTRFESKFVFTCFWENQPLIALLSTFFKKIGAKIEKSIKNS